jgi:hypothetical protein
MGPTASDRVRRTRGLIFMLYCVSLCAGVGQGMATHVPPRPGLQHHVTPGHLRAQHLPHNGVYASHSEKMLTLGTHARRLQPRTILCIEEVIVVGCAPAGDERVVGRMILLLKVKRVLARARGAISAHGLARRATVFVCYRGFWLRRRRPLHDAKLADGTASTIFPQLERGHALCALDSIDCEDEVARAQARFRSRRVGIYANHLVGVDHGHADLFVRFQLKGEGLRAA